MSAANPNRRNRQPKRAVLPGIRRDDSDDELGVDDHPWEWIYADHASTPQAKPDGSSRKRKRVAEDEAPIVGARMGSFECKVGDTVLLKAEGSSEAWVGLICEFLKEEETDDGEKAARFMWFSSQSEIRNKEKKRTDFLSVSHAGSSWFPTSEARILTHFL